MSEPRLSYGRFSDEEAPYADSLLDWLPEDEHGDDTPSDDIAEEVAKLAILRAEEEAIAAIISDLHPRTTPANKLSHLAVGLISYEGDARGEVPVEPSVGRVARTIVAYYYKEEARLKRYKRLSGLRSLQYDVWVAIIRNDRVLSASDRHYIEEEAGLVEHGGRPVPPKREDASAFPRKHNFRERQFKDGED